MRLNWKLPCVQVKRPIKINTYHLIRVCKTRTQEIPPKELHKSKGQLNKNRKDTKVFRDSPYPYLASCGNQSFEIQITGFRKTQDKKEGNLRTDSSNESQ